MTPPVPTDASVLALATGALGREASTLTVGGSALDPAQAPRPADTDADRLLGLVLDRARLAVTETGTSLVTSLDDPTLGAIRLALTEGADGLILAELTVADPRSVDLLLRSAERHRAAGELASVDLRIRPEAVRTDTAGGRGDGPGSGAAGGSAADPGSSRDGRRPDRDASMRPFDVLPPQRPVRARRDARDHAPAGVTRLGRTIDRTA